MSQALDLLDNALEMARREKAALEEGAYEEAIELAEERTKISGMAWNAMTSGDASAYRSKLLELSRLQDYLSQIASSAREKIRASLTRSRQEKKRISGYRMAVEQALQ